MHRLVTNVAMKEPTEKLSHTDQYSPLHRRSLECAVNMLEVPGPEPERRTPTTEFERRVIQCVDSGLSVLGRNAMFPTYWYLEHAFGLRRDDIPRRPRAARYALRQMFGAGAATLESAIAAEIIKTFHLPTASGKLEDLLREASLTAGTPASYV